MNLTETAIKKQLSRLTLDELEDRIEAKIRDLEEIAIPTEYNKGMEEGLEWVLRLIKVN